MSPSSSDRESFDPGGGLVDTPAVFLDDMRRKHRELAALVKRILELKRRGYDPKNGRTIGLVVPDEIRERLEIQRGKHHIRSYRGTVLVAVCLGLTILETAGGSPGSAWSLIWSPAPPAPYSRGMTRFARRMPWTVPKGSWRLRGERIVSR